MEAEKNEAEKKKRNEVFFFPLDDATATGFVRVECLSVWAWDSGERGEKRETVFVMIFCIHTGT